jgi:SpoVK/Ycf46/Vps4 family AAA+-type ATPase
MEQELVRTNVEKVTRGIDAIELISMRVAHWRVPGSQEVHEKAPITRSVLIAGPKGCGKKMLVHAIVTELGATLFDLTARNIAGKYPGKSGLVMLMHLVNKVI